MPITKLKLKAIAQEYISNGFNATRAVMKVTPKKNLNVANNSASRLLANAKFKQEVGDLLPSSDKDLEQFNKAFNAKVDKKITYTDLAKFLELSLKAKGKLNNDNAKGNTNIGIVIEK